MTDPTSVRTPNPSQTIPAFLIIALMGILAALVYISRQDPNRDQSSQLISNSGLREVIADSNRLPIEKRAIRTPSLKLSGIEIARSTWRFVDTLKTRDSETPDAYGMFVPPEDPAVSLDRYNLEPIAHLAKTYRDGSMSLTALPADPAPASAWRILAIIGALQFSEDSNSRADLLARWKLNDEALKRSANNVVEFNLLHQYFEAFISDVGLEPRPSAIYLWDRLRFLKDVAARSLEWEEGLTHPIILVVFARQLAQGAWLLRNGPFDDIRLSANFPTSPGAQQDLYADMTRLSAALIDKVNAISQPPNFQAIVDGSPETHQYACFTNWARMALYRATNDSQHLDAVKRFFESVDLSGEALKRPHFGITHSVLACAHALKELAVVDPSYRLHLKDIIEEFVLPVWDYSGSPLCDGDGGVFMSQEWDPVSTCANSEKNQTDAAWLIHLLADDESTFELR